jgi:hypothetical protein
MGTEQQCDVGRVTQEKPWGQFQRVSMTSELAVLFSVFYQNFRFYHSFYVIMCNSCLLQFIAFDKVM